MGKHLLGDLIENRMKDLGLSRDDLGALHPRGIAVDARASKLGIETGPVRGWGRRLK